MVHGLQTVTVHDSDTAALKHSAVTQHHTFSPVTWHSVECSRTAEAHGRLSV